MKRILTILVLLAVSTAAFAQRAPKSTSYNDLKKVYSARNYVKSSSDPYSVFWIGLESLGVPGMGQLIMKETGRGWAFIGANAAGDIAMYIMVQDLVNNCIQKDAGSNYYIPDDMKDAASKKLVAIGCVALAELAVDIWSCVDAVKIAKVKNQYYQDLQKNHPFSATLHPSVNLVQTGTSTVPAAGMTLALTF